jgi:hypothetical protein
MRLVVAALLVVAASGAAQSPPTVEQDIARRVRADVEFLASDSLEGRDTGSRGYLIAANYVAAQFRAIGLEPAGDKGGWYQQVPFRRASFEKQPVLTMTIGGRQVPLDPARDATVRPSVTEKLRELSAGFVFVGYGIRDARHNIDDYRGLDLKGKIAVALGGAPKGLPTDISASEAGAAGA